jgi:ADP-ribose pyrophosphatase YjhB (NUDIX family)
MGGRSKLIMKSIFILQNMVSVTTNKYGDTLVESNGSSFDLPVDPEKKYIFKGFDTAPEGSSLMYNSDKFGPLFATKVAIKNHPRVENDIVLGGTTVVFISNFTVLVKAKGRSFLTNPGGGAEWGETLRDSAVRETLEETGLIIKDPIPFAEWGFRRKFGGLEWENISVGFYTTTDKPDKWNLSKKINRIDIDDEEIEYLIVADLDSLQELKDLTGLHLDLINLAKMKSRIHPYLTSFKTISENTFVDFDCS